MAALEEEGYIFRPHVSSGAVPADKGYRFYVQQRLKRAVLTRREQTLVRDRFQRVERDMDAWANLATLMLSELVRNLAIVTVPRAPQSRLRQIEVVYLQELLIMLVLVFQGARLRKSLVSLQEPVVPEELGAMSARLNAHYAGLSQVEMHARRHDLTPLEEQVMVRAFDLMEEEDRVVSDEYLAQGLRHLLAQPEFLGNPRASELVEALEERRLVQALLQAAPQFGTVRVIIGDENEDAALKPLSIVVGQYGVAGGMSGVVGIVGPTRMAYDRTVAGVEYLQSLMSERVQEVQGQPLPS
jgi:heat-inducible transcriptional repressor